MGSNNEKWLNDLFDKIDEKNKGRKESEQIIMKDLYYQTDLLLKARLVDSLNRINDKLSFIKAKVFVK